MNENYVTLGQVCEKGSSNVAQKDLEEREGQYPIYGAAGLIKTVDFAHQKQPYIAVVKDGASIGRVMKLPAYSSVIGTMQYIFPKENVDIDYLFYALQHMNLGKYFSGSTIPHIYFRDYQKELLKLPAMKVQQCQAETLSRIDTLSSYAQKQIFLFDELIKSRFVEMFVKSNLSSEWPCQTISDVSLDMRTGPFGSALHHDEFVDEGVFVLGIDNAVGNKFSYNRMRYITESKYQKLKRYTVYPGDVIITIMGTVGQSAVIPKNMPKAINTKHLVCITPNSESIDSQFLSSAFQIHPIIRLQLQKQCKGAIMDGLNLTVIKGLSFPIPPITLQKQFVKFYDQVDKSKLAVTQSLEKLEMLKKSLMQQYFG